MNTISGSDEPAALPATKHRVVTDLTIALLIIMTWMVSTWIGWIGFVGSDDMYYTRYAWLLHRMPMNWWEFRFPYIISLRGAFLVFGPTEWAACLPGLLASLVALISVHYYLKQTGGPVHDARWRATYVTSLLLMTLLPIAVVLRSYPVAPSLAMGILSAGTATFLAGSTTRIRILGAVLLGLAVLVHETALFYVAFLYLASLLFDVESRTLIIRCIAISVTIVIFECALYGYFCGDPLIRYRVAESESTLIDWDHEFHGGPGALAFYLWPLLDFTFSKAFGFDLIILSWFALRSWRCLKKADRILLVALLTNYLWLRYGTKVPWGYKPFARQIHLSFPLAFGVACLLPRVVVASRSDPTRASLFLLAIIVTTHVLVIMTGGQWGGAFRVSRELLVYAQHHRDKFFVTDITTLNHMYVANGFRLPQNVICMNQDSVRRHLIVNKEPSTTPRRRYDPISTDGSLVNLNVLDNDMSDEVKSHREAHRSCTWISPPSYRIGLKLLSNGGVLCK
jgi:hypothetical protein